MICLTIILDFTSLGFKKREVAGNMINMMFILVLLAYLINEKVGVATLFLAPVERWKGPSGPAMDLWPHLK